MHIVLFHHRPVPALGHGGTERVVVWLARGLVELGHQVTVVAGRGSRVPEARVIEVDPEAAADPSFDLRPLLPRGVDVVHAHRPFPPTEAPTLWTMHGNATGALSRYPANMVGVSRDHARRHGIATFVYNGLDPAEYRFAPVKGEWDLFLGRLRTAKGWQWAIEGARRAARPLIVAGGWRVPWWPRVRFAGEVRGDRKRDLLAEAACLWMPVRWEEPFGLAAIEALVSGTPVLGTPRGALPEIVTGEVGALGATVDELVALRPSLDRLDPEACRARVERLFTHRAMAESYLAVYRAVIAGGL